VKRYEIEHDWLKAGTLDSSRSIGEPMMQRYLSSQRLTWPIDGYYPDLKARVRLVKTYQEGKWKHRAARAKRQREVV
jgi:hypothetical protein